MLTNSEMVRKRKFVRKLQEEFAVVSSIRGLAMRFVERSPRMNRTFKRGSSSLRFQGFRLKNVARNRNERVEKGGVPIFSREVRQMKVNLLCPQVSPMELRDGWEHRLLPSLINPSTIHQSDHK